MKAVFLGGLVRKAIKYKNLEQVNKRCWSLRYKKRFFILRHHLL